ncbi:hypothetical protein M0R45_029031 [Rubus argutus]|uniref:Uncharacterized protein n=1 Tax=Rubus argutus TaxID=59490 RepID=A0AAW1W6J9_RUBAR
MPIAGVILQVEVLKWAGPWLVVLNSRFFGFRMCSWANDIEMIKQLNNEATTSASAATAVSAPAGPSTETGSFWHGHRFLSFLLACIYGIYFCHIMALSLQCSFVKSRKDQDPGEEEEYETGPVSSGKDKETKESVPRGRLWFVRNLTGEEVEEEDLCSWSWDSWTL